eukprot:scaffold326328_cov26-Prasinocladus_malaysianus.AAC.1
MDDNSDDTDIDSDFDGNNDVFFSHPIKAHTATAMWASSAALIEAASTTTYSGDSIYVGALVEDTFLSQRSTYFVTQNLSTLSVHIRCENWSYRHDQQEHRQMSTQHMLCSWRRWSNQTATRCA